MAPSKDEGNGRVDRLKETMAALGQSQLNLEQVQTALLQALANMAQNQTPMAQQQAAILARMAENDRLHLELERPVLWHGGLLKPALSPRHEIHPTGKVVTVKIGPPQKFCNE